MSWLSFSCSSSCKITFISIRKQSKSLYVQSLISSIFGVYKSASELLNKCFVTFSASWSSRSTCVAWPSAMGNRALRQLRIKIEFQTSEFKRHSMWFSKHPGLQTHLPVLLAFSFGGLFQNPAMKAMKRVIKIIETSLLVGHNSCVKFTWSRYVKVLVVAYVMKVYKIPVNAPVGY